MQTVDNRVWSPQLVEELLFQQFIKNQDVNRLLPPPPKTTHEHFLDKYNQSTKILLSYVRNGPVTALSSQNVNTAVVGKHYSMTPAKPLLTRTPSAKPPLEHAPVARTHARSPTPKGSRAPSTAKAGSTSPPPAQYKRAKVEWPAQVPTNNALKSNSRSKIAPLTMKRVAAQESVDPDLIFSQNPGELPINAIFAQYPKALKSVSAVRNASGDWRSDTFTPEEEQMYKADLRFSFFGPSQCTYGKGLL